MHAPVSADQLKTLQEADAPYEGDLKDPAVWKFLPLILVFLGAVAAAITVFGSPAVTVLGLGGTATMFAIIFYLTRQ